MAIHFTEYAKFLSFRDSFFFSPAQANIFETLNVEIFRWDDNSQVQYIIYPWIRSVNLVWASNDWLASHPFFSRIYYSCSNTVTTYPLGFQPSQNKDGSIIKATLLSNWHCRWDMIVNTTLSAFEK